MKIHAGDTVVVITGKDKGKTGTVLRVLAVKNRIIVAGINMRTKHIKKTQQRAGQRIKYEASLHISNVMLVDPKDGKRTRAGIRTDEKGRKMRFAKRSGQEIKRGAAAAKTETKAGGKKAGAKKTKQEMPDGAPPTKQPFWKRLGFGADAMEGEVKSEPNMKKDHTVPPDNQIPERMGSGRGS